MRYWAKPRNSNQAVGLERLHLQDGKGIVSPFLFAYSPVGYKYTRDTVDHLVELYDIILLPFYVGAEEEEGL